MSKKIFISIGLIILILIIAAANYYYFIYQKPVENKSSEEQTGQGEEQTGEEEVLDNQELANLIIDGILQKVEDDFMYIRVEDKEEIVKLTGETTFSEMTFSTEMELIEEKDISLSDIEEGNSISIIVPYNEDNGEEKTALAIRLIIVSD